MDQACPVALVRTGLLGDVFDARNEEPGEGTTGNAPIADSFVSEWRLALWFAFPTQPPQYDPGVVLNKDCLGLEVSSLGAGVVLEARPPREVKLVIVSEPANTDCELSRRLSRFSKICLEQKWGSRALYVGKVSGMAVASENTAREC